MMAKKFSAGVCESRTGAERAR